MNVRAAVRIALPDVVVSRQAPVTTTTRHVPLARTMTANLNDSSYSFNPIYQEGRVGGLEGGRVGGRKGMKVNVNDWKIIKVND